MKNIKIKNLSKIALFCFLMLIAVSFALPSFSEAQSPVAASTCSPNVNNIGDMLCRIGKILQSIIPLLIALGVVYFVWGVIQYVIAGGDEAKKKGRDTMIFGVIGFTVITGLWGIVKILISTFDISSTAPSLVTVPGASSACNLITNPKLGDLIDYITCFIGRSVIPLIFALAVVVFVWGVVQFLILGASEEAKRAQGKQLMIWGIIGLAVMLSIWGLVSIVGGTFNLNTNVLPQVRPNLP